MDRYPAYKDSGVEWLGEIPKHWTIKRLRHISSFITVGVVVNPSSYVTDHGVPFLFGSEVTEQGINIKKTRRIPKAISDGELRKTRLETGDLVTVRVGYPGVTAVVPPELEGANCASIMLVRKSNTFDSFWLCYAMNSRIGRYQVEQVQYGAAQEQFNISHAINFIFPVPPLAEQRLIAQYLDRQTAKIDTLTTAKQHLLELLTEKRRALITHAITRGLNPDVPIRDSEADWYGKIPQHWEVKRLRWFIKNLEQGWSPQAEGREPAEDEWGVLKLNAVKDGQFDPSKAKALPTSVEVPLSLEIHPGDFLITRANTPELVVCYVQKTRPYLMLSDLIYRLRLDESKLDGQFLSFFLQSPISRLQIEADARGSSASMVKISQGHILDWLLLIPPLHEQQMIVSYITSKISKIDVLKIAIEQAITLLQERRAALISAAVTGQIRIPS